MEILDLIKAVDRLELIMLHSQLEDLPAEDLGEEERVPTLLAEYEAAKGEVTPLKEYLRINGVDPAKTRLYIPQEAQLHLMLRTKNNQTEAHISNRAKKQIEKMDEPRRNDAITTLTQLTNFPEKTIIENLKKIKTMKHTYKMKKNNTTIIFNYKKRKQTMQILYIRN
jgi:mRNA-degrading endonuclease RelE of RelBE toxin-antitoxin system